MVVTHVSDNGNVQFTQAVYLRQPCSLYKLITGHVELCRKCITGKLKDLRSLPLFSGFR